MWTRLNGVREDCELDSIAGIAETNYILKKQSDMNAWIELRRRAFLCGNEEWAVEAMACELEDIKQLQNTMLCSCIMNAIQALICLLLSIGFVYFSNVPASHLSSSSTARRLVWCGGFCKHGPWIVRLLHFIQLIVWMIFVSDLQVKYQCRGDTTYSYDCANAQNDCAYTQLLNCRYYHGSKDCGAPSEVISEGGEVTGESPLLSCFNPEFRSSFTGSVDIRLISDSTCMRCNLLSLDLETKDVNDFGLSDHQVEPQSAWCMEADSTTCFKLKAVHILPLFCSCPRDMGSRVTQDQRDKYGLNPENCANFESARRLGMLPNYTKEFPNEYVTMPTAIPTGPEPKVRPEKTWVHPVPEASPLQAPQRKLVAQEMTKNETVGLLVEYFDLLQSTNPVMEDDYFGISHLWDIDEVCSTGTDDSDLCTQECDWAPQTYPDFFFEKANCEQPGSWLYRHCMMYCYSFMCGWLVMTLVGVIVKISAKPETWFFNPHEANELFFWQWLRILGP